MSLKFLPTLAFPYGVKREILLEGFAVICRVAANS